MTYTLTAGNLMVTPATLNFTQTSGGTAPAAQTVNVTSSGVPLNYSVLTNVTTTTNWLSATPTSGTTPGMISVSANAGNLQPGTYMGTVTITSSSAGNSPQTVTVNLTVGQPQSLAVLPTSLNFGSQFGAPAPATQTVAVTASNGLDRSRTAAASVTSGPAGWLSVSPASGMAGQTPTNLTVTVNPQGLSVGTYNGTITVTGQGASNPPAGNQRHLHRDRHPDAGSGQSAKCRRRQPRASRARRDHLHLRHQSRSRYGSH